MPDSTEKITVMELMLSKFADIANRKVKAGIEISKAESELLEIVKNQSAESAEAFKSRWNPVPEEDIRKLNEAPQEANAEATEGKSSSTLDSHSLPISVLKLARGWEEKLSAAGVSTVGGLGEYISDGCLKPGCLPRVGPEAVEKIRAAYQEYTGTALSPTTGPSTLASDQVPASYIPAAFDACYAEGKRFAEAGAKAIENPHPRGTALWASWDRGWQETFAVMEADDEATREEGSSVASTPEPTPEPAPTSGPEIPDLDLSPSSASDPAAPVPDDEFDDL